MRSLIGISAFAILPRALSGRSLRLTIALAPRGPRARELHNGVMLSLAEIRRAAALFNRRAPAIVAREGDVIIAALDTQDTRSLAEKADSAKRVILNCNARDDSLRRDLCSPFVFHVEASDAMYEAASKAVATGSRAVLWSSRLEKYGASQLNDRFSAAYSAPMSPAAWAGWFAVKAVWEAMLRSRSDDPSSIAAYMASESAEFDGHKGAPLSFRKWDHQLRQPLYALDDSGKGGGVQDVPDLGRSSLPARELLDTIGDPAAVRQCRRN